MWLAERSHDLKLTVPTGRLRAHSRGDDIEAPRSTSEPDYGTTTGAAEFSPVDDDQAARDYRRIESDSLIQSRQVTIPTSGATDGPDLVLDNVYHLVTDPEFVTARARMYAYLAGMAAGAVPEDEIVDRLQAAAAAYDRKIAEYNKAGVRRTIHQVVPTAANYADLVLDERDVLRPASMPVRS
jgi:hypothetical protein